MITKYLDTILGFFVALLIYFSLLSVRLTIPDSDLTRVVDEFNAIGMSDYNLREPVYWFVGKVLTTLVGDAWAAIATLDVMAAAMVAYAVRGGRLPGIAFVALMISPMILLGVCNIHRQMIGFAAWMLIERMTEDKSAVRSVPWHVIPFLIHSSMGILSFVYFLTQAIKQRDLVVIFGMSAFVIVSVLLFGETVFQFFRQGTDTTTSVLGYLAWAALIFPLILFGVGDEDGMVTFYVLGCAVATGLFVVSGGSSGSRFFMLVITVCATWAFTRAPLLLQPGLQRNLYVAALAFALVLPSFGATFSLEILRAAALGVPYGASI